MDVEGFGDQRRTNPHQVAVRTGLYRALRKAFRKAKISWASCYHEDRGDGVIVLAPADVPKSRFVESLPYELGKLLRDHNTASRAEDHVRLRVAVHAGEIIHDDHGVTGGAINLAFRLLDAGPLKAALAESPGVLALIASAWYFDEVVRHSTTVDAATYRPVRVRVKETATVGWICLPDYPYPPDTTAARTADAGTVVPRQLPAAARHFVGRDFELTALTSLLEHTTEPGDPVVVSTIDGTAGVGKTALAVYWAHQVADRFPDGQLYVNLRGFDAAASEMTPAEAVRGFLDAFEISPERIPVNLDAQAALYRSLLATRKVLILLDNARDVDQVRPLLPGSPGCLVVVTSRNLFTSLIAAQGACPLTLDLLTNAEARALLIRHLGPDRVAAEPQAVDKIITSCAQLPLALSIVAVRAATHSTFPLTALAGELGAARTDLDAFDGGDLAANVRAVFSWSYQRLSEAAARTFRLMGLHPGPDISVPATASLTGVTPARARSTVAELSRAHLVDERIPGRIAFHDLLRAYAAELTHALDPEHERRTAVRRVLDHYLHTAHTAALRLHTRWAPITLPSSQPGVAAEQLAQYQEAWAWFETEQQVLLAAVHLAVATRNDGHAWRLPWTLSEFLQRKGHWRDLVDTHRAALIAARRGADLYGQAHAYRGLGRAFPWLGSYDKAHAHLQQALDSFEEIGDRTGQADTHLDLGWILEHQDRHAEALIHARRGLALSRAVGYRPCQARALNNIGRYLARLGDPHQTLALCREALALREPSDRRGEATALDGLGYAHHHLAHYEQAIACYQQALTRSREVNDRYEEANVLAHLGDTYHAVGDLTGAYQTWQQALDILHHLGHNLGASSGYPDTEQIRAKLHGLKGRISDNTTTSIRDTPV